MTLLQYEVLKTVVETESFTRAGEKLGLTQSAISHAIRGLETELELTLMNRGRSGITLTNEGIRMMEYIQEILDLSERMKQEAGLLNGLKIGTIRIGTFPSVSASLLPSILKQFHQAFPGIQTEIYEGGYEEIKQMITSGKIDIGFLTSSTSESLDFIPLMEDHLYILLPDSHKLKRRKRISIHEISDEPFIMPKAGCDELIKGLFKENKILPQIFCEIADNQTIMAMVAKELGVSIVPELVLQGDTRKNVAAVTMKENCYRTIGLAVNSLERCSPAAEAFIELAKKSFIKN
ncbi:DNA-binding transcriptional regulator, LysR family [Bacillus sp. OV194]|nr:DNA-binding transcriptional regulator, LysR family [Bacillus sp. OV194]